MMNITEIESMKDKLVDTLGLWADDRITSLANSNPRLEVASVYMKRGVNNYLHREKERIGKVIDYAFLFMCDENGKVDFSTFFNDLMAIFRDMDEIPFSLGLTAGTIGKGVIRIQIPDNIFTNILFGNMGSIKVTESDIKDLFDLITSESE